MRAFSVILFLSVWSVSHGQDCASERYLSNIFQSVVSQDVVYGNSPALTAMYVAENVTVDQDMTMDIFFPVGDDLPKHPAVMLAYGGGYLFGTKEDEDVWTTCDSLAKKGYVTASINYRMNMNVASSASAVRAIYRAAQDYSSALRYLKEYSDAFGIDTNYIFAGGVSAGGFSAMHMAFLDESERPAETYQSGIGGINPDLGCLSCEGNGFQHSHEVRGIINLWGALMDTAYIQQDEVVPMTLFHGTNDLIVPYDYGFPFTALFVMPEVFGSAGIATHVSNLGGNPELNLFQGVGHNIWGVNVNNQLVGGPTEHWVPITDSIISFLYENIRPEAPNVLAPASVCQGDTVHLVVSNLPNGGRVCWDLQDAIIIDASLDSSELDMVWENVGVFDVSVTIFNHLEAASIPFEVEIEVNPTPVVNITVDGNILEASGNYPYYEWYLNGNFIQGENQSTITALQSGVYSVVAVNQYGCTSISDGVQIVGISEFVIEEKPTKVKLYDLTGRLVSETTYKGWLKNQIGIKGVLIAEFYSADGELLERRKVLR